MVNYDSIALVHPKNEPLKTIAKNTKYINPLNKSLRVFFKEAVSISVKNPSQALYFVQTVRNQQKASRVRAKWHQEGVPVPRLYFLVLLIAAIYIAKGVITRL